MPYITAQELLDKLPLNGEGISALQAELAVDSAIEDVVGRTGDEAGESSMLRTAVEHMATADLEDAVGLADARGRGELHTLRANGERLVRRFLENEALKKGAEDTDTDGAPDGAGYVGVMDW